MKDASSDDNDEQHRRAHSPAHVLADHVRTSTTVHDLKRHRLALDTHTRVSHECGQWLGQARHHAQHSGQLERTSLASPRHARLAGTCHCRIFSIWL